MSKNFFSVFALTLLGAAAAYSQSGVIRGSLSNATGSAIAGAKISAVNVQRSITVRETNSDANGEFQLSPLEPGTYNIRAEATGFKTANRTGLVLDVNQTLKSVRYSWRSAASRSR